MTAQRRVSLLVITAAIVSGAAQQVLASTGGPQLAEVLGWDPADHKVFCRITYVDESGDPQKVCYFDLAGRSPSQLVSVGWSLKEGSSYDAKMKAKPDERPGPRDTVRVVIPKRHP